MADVDPCRGSIVSWTIQQVGQYSTGGYVGAVAATCSDGSALAPVTYGYNGTGKGRCNGTLRQPKSVPSPEGNLTVRCNPSTISIIPQH